MPPASPALLRLSERFLSWRRPGRTLTLLARTSVPVLRPDWYASRQPESGLDGAEISSLMVTSTEASSSGGALAGAPVAIKDSLDVRNLPTGLGLRTPGATPTTDAILVARIRAAGGHIVGKAKMTELGMDGVGALMHAPMPRNPRAPGYFPGGSSTGSAVAVAAGVARYGIGSDGLGSVRIPAAYCGLVGLKGSHGRLPTLGYHSPVESLDVPGPIARTVDDCARLWQVLADEPIAALTALVPERVGLIRQLGPARASRAIQAAFARMLEALGVRPETVEVPGAECCTFLGGLIGAHELAHSQFGDHDLTLSGRMNVALGRSFSDRDAARLTAQRDQLRDATAAALAVTPILAMPTTAVPPPALSRALLAGDQDLLLLRALGCYTPLANLTGLPAIAVPCGIDDRGRPLSIMFMGAAGSETTLLRIALAVEQTGLGTRAIS